MRQRPETRRPFPRHPSLEARANCPCMPWTRDGFAPSRPARLQLVVPDGNHQISARACQPRQARAGGPARNAAPVPKPLAHQPRYRKRFGQRRVPGIPSSALIGARPQPPASFCPRDTVFWRRSRVKAASKKRLVPTCSAGVYLDRPRWGPSSVPHSPRDTHE